MFSEFFVFHVPLWQWLLSQGFGVVRLILVVIAWQVHKKSKTMAIVLVGVAFSVGSNILLENWIAVALGSSVFIRFLVFVWMEVNREKLKKWMLWACLFGVWAMQIIVVYFTNNGFWFNWLFLAGNLLATYGAWAKGIHLIRITKIQLSILIIINAFMFRNLMNIIIEVMSLISVAVFYMRLARKRRSVEQGKKNTGAQLQESQLVQVVDVDMELAGLE